MQRLTAFFLVLVGVTPLAANEPLFFNGSPIYVPQARAPQTVAPVANAPQPVQSLQAPELTSIQPPYIAGPTPITGAVLATYGQPSSPPLSQPAQYAPAEVFYGRAPTRPQPKATLTSRPKPKDSRRTSFSGTKSDANKTQADQPVDELNQSILPGYANGVANDPQLSRNSVDKNSQRTQAGNTKQAKPGQALDPRVQQFVSGLNGQGLSQFGFNDQPLNFQGQNRLFQSPLGGSRISDSKVNQSQFGQSSGGLSFHSQSQFNQHQRYSTDHLTRSVEPGQQSRGTQVRINK